MAQHSEKVLSGQHRTHAGNEFVYGVRAVENEWRACFGTQLVPQVYRRMPKRLARRLSAGFQDKESKPQVQNVVKSVLNIANESLGGMY